MLPEKTIKHKGGNCIDLTVLFASLLEGLGIYSYIYLTKNHAFIGWGDPKNWKNCLFLETTLIGNASFEDALTAGAKAFKDNFILGGTDGLLPIDLIYKMNGSRIINLHVARQLGIVAKSC